MQVKSNTKDPKNRILIALADGAHRKRIKALLPADSYQLSWAADAKTTRRRLAGKAFDALIVDIAARHKGKRVAYKGTLKAVRNLPVIILPEGQQGTVAALRTCGVMQRILSWDILDGNILRAMIALVIQTDRERLMLHESEQHFARAFQASPGMFTISTPKDGRHVDVNDTWLTVMGYKRHQIIGKTAREMGIWVDYSDRARLVRALHQNRHISGFETRFQSKKGKVIDVIINGEVIDIAEKSHLLLIAMDITNQKKIERKLKDSHDELEFNIYERTDQLRQEVEERKNIQAALEQSEQRVRDMAEAASDWFWETDAKGRFTYLSASHRKILGVNPSEVIGKKRDMLVVPGDDAEKWRKHAKIIRARKPFRDFQYDHVRASGQPQTVKTSGKPVYDKKGKFFGYRGAGTNITPQVAAQRREAKMRRQFHDAVEGISDGLILFDANEKFVMCNSRPKEMFSRISGVFVPGTPAKKIMRAIVEAGYLVSARENPEKWIRERLAEIQTIGDRKTQREELMHDGSWIRFNEYKTSEGGRLLLVTDVTNLRHTEKELRGAKDQAEVASRAKSDFLAGMSHELRTPLNAIIGFSDVMMSQVYGAIPQEKYREYIEDINRSGSHLLDLINDILDISKIESGTVKLDISRVDVGEIIVACVRLFANRCREGGLTIKKRVSRNLPPIKADKRRVNQVLLNLVSNAVKFTKEGGRVQISAAVLANGTLSLSVSDTGIGINPHDIEKVMTEFGQVDSAVARKNEGTGLGLPLTRGLMEVHGGELKIASKIGRGTTVTAIFPKQRVLKKRL